MMLHSCCGGLRDAFSDKKTLCISGANSRYLSNKDRRPLTPVFAEGADGACLRTPASGANLSPPGPFPGVELERYRARVCVQEACSAIQYKIFGLVYEGDYWGMVALQFCDSRSDTWHTVEIVGRFPESPLATMGATDGGLVCWIESLTNKKKTPLWIMVCNPLQRTFRELQLPSGALRSAQPSMVQLVVDGFGSKNYKVIAVGPMRRHRGVVYHAASDTWTSTESLPGCVFGEEYERELTEEEDEDDGVYYDVYETVAVVPCAFDSASSQLVDLRDDSYPCAGPSFVEYARVKDRLFCVAQRRYRSAAWTAHCCGVSSSKQESALGESWGISFVNQPRRVIGCSRSVFAPVVRM